MNQFRSRVLIPALFMLLFILGCGLGTTGPAAVSQLSVEEIAAKTWSAMQAIAALSATPTASPIPPSNTPTITPTPTITRTPTPTDTPIPPLTQRPTSTPGPTATATPRPVTVTSIYNYYYKTATAKAACKPPKCGGGGGGGQFIATCLAARLVRDVTVPDNMWIPRNTPFTKIWRIQNIGQCVWRASETQMVFTGGNQMSGASSVPLPSDVRPGNTIDIAVNLISPNDLTGTIYSFWGLQVGSKRFGDYKSNKAFDVVLNVNNTTPGIIYDLRTNYCQASWYSSRKTSLRCPGTPEDSRIGYVQQVQNVILENGLQITLGLLTSPPSLSDASIIGPYPAIYTPAGSRFVTDIGCPLDPNRPCKVVFSAYYQVIGAPNPIPIFENVEIYGTGAGGEGDGDSDVSPHIEIPLPPDTANTLTFLFLKVKALESSSRSGLAIWNWPRIVP